MQEGTEKIGYKVVLVNHGSDKKTSTFASGDLEVVYSPNITTYADSELAARGFGLCYFEKLKHAERYLGRTSCTSWHYELWKVMVGREVKMNSHLSMFPPRRKNDLLTRSSEIAWVPNDEFMAHDLPFKMAESITLLEKIS